MFIFSSNLVRYMSSGTQANAIVDRRMVESWCPNEQCRCFVIQPFLLQVTPLARLFAGATEYLAVLVRRLLADADIFASVSYRRDIALGLTRHLKLEQRIPGKAEDLLRHFADRIGKAGLHSGAGRRLLASAVASRHAALNTVAADSVGRAVA